ncbi:hypothetical protein ACHHYP_08450 [Achlya hypogyna]|uniref:Glycosyl transferase family 1 domain-containing protein n=1 Tax=Achlya hypogyna TaxID=1202772 RepID=A0A1V9ZKL0_ACHHY|nr:hypothetical protein ACHHYP_08450 [Achlya hypogyna]
MKPRVHGAQRREATLLVGAVVFFGILVALSQLLRRSALETTLRPTIDTDPLIDDSLHLHHLNAICAQAKDAIVPHSYNSSVLDMTHVWQRTRDQQTLRQLLSQCPQVDVFLPRYLRTRGGCEDAMAYVKFLRARALPRWVFDLSWSIHGEVQTYFDLCPETALVFLGHDWGGLDKLPSFPADKRVILMANVESPELEPYHLHRADFVLAKTQDAHDRLRAWYKASGNPRQTRVLYTQHTSSNPALAVARDASLHRPAQDFNQLRFVHANGPSERKGTAELLACWAARPDFPLLDVYASDAASQAAYNALFPDPSRVPSNLRYHHGTDLSPFNFGRVLVQASVVLCPSTQESFGHSINQARAAGALVAATGARPMSELVTPASGVLIPAVPDDGWPQLLASQYWFWQRQRSLRFTVSASAICRSVDDILAMPASERAARARNGQTQYYEQLVQFKDAMRALRVALIVPDTSPESLPTALA